jgi:hypothetical protein
LKASNVSDLSHIMWRCQGCKKVKRLFDIGGHNTLSDLNRQTGSGLEHFLDWDIEVIEEGPDTFFISTG